MTEYVYDGNHAINILLQTQGIWDYNSTRIFVNGAEVNPKDVEIIIYNDEEQD